MQGIINSVTADVLGFLAYLLIFSVGLAILAVVVLYIIDRTQTTHAIRRNYPVIGRFRYLFEHLGEFFRQYFFALDREEMPFNRADRSWVYRAAKNVDSTGAFGSTRDIYKPGEELFLNCAFPTLDEDSAPTATVTISDTDRSRKPWLTNHLVNISGMSFGAISVPAVRALSRGASQGGAWLNTGEGGLSPYHLEGGCDLVFQIGTAKYGVRDDKGNLSDKKLAEVSAHEQVRMFEIKLSQGAKPGKGGILPGGKVNEEIARIRGIPVHIDSISPNRHPEINSVDDLLDMIARVRAATGKPTGFKTVVGSYGWLEEMCARIHQRGLEFCPDFITVDSADGGTGAAPVSLLDYAGLPVRESLPMVVDLLCEAGLRQKVRVVCSGKLVQPARVAWALCAGADFVTSARGFMFALGCIQALQCNKNTCPTGITTHNKKLQRGLMVSDKSTRVANFIRNINYEVGILAHSCGVAEPRLLRRHHVRIVQASGPSIPLSELHPAKTARAGSGLAG
ncbi:MAG: FMN-binding glutamate synthase family protein [Proteobacteria bacterium]|nr:FMN-binding glutamate synthase family protein [Pseudomonadota bacterium]